MLDVGKNGENATESIKILKKAAASNLIDNIDTTDQNKEILQNQLTDMLAEVDIPSLEIGTEIQDIKGMDGFRHTLAQMVADSQINTDEVNAILNGISFKSDGTGEDIPVQIFDKTAFQS